jgi:hypothetical protein
VENRAFTEDSGNHRLPNSPGKPNIPRFFSIVVTGGFRVRGAAGAAGVGGDGGRGAALRASEPGRRVDREPSLGPVFTAGIWPRARRNSRSATARRAPLIERPAAPLIETDPPALLAPASNLSSAHASLSRWWPRARRFPPALAPRKEIILLFPCNRMHTQGNPRAGDPGS